MIAGITVNKQTFTLCLFRRTSFVVRVDGGDGGGCRRCGPLFVNMGGEVRYFVDAATPICVEVFTKVIRFNRNHSYLR